MFWRPLVGECEVVAFPEELNDAVSGCATAYSLTSTDIA
jgi:hypothetical protein